MLPLTAPHLEQTEISHITLQAQAIQTLHPDSTTPPILMHPIYNGIAIRTFPQLTGKLNRVVGLGMGLGINHEFSHADLDVLELLYAEIGLTPDIHLCEEAHPSVQRVLRDRAYRCWGELGVYVRGLGGEMEGEMEGGTGGAEVSELVISPSEHGSTKEEEEEEEEKKAEEEFIEASIAGFSEQGRSRELLGLLARIAVLRADTRLFVARVQGQVVGTAALGVLETQDGERVGHLYLDSTVPRFRGLGVHVQLIRARVRCARQMGLRIVTLSTGVKGGSKRNAEREGFELVYRKRGFVKGVLGYES
ncbi:hypothetical protein BO70DRAFT_350515 [Aspergillus heteromorphus CBS 117.55]|uniref:N-acetyltransferase domain-containing protein n=1 Tax=Aspergillus heteromorphus CBS 117.55 TaxID=1448321 RepID=A0A317WS93_9EURO|nr:uncharacterized protein BO70DRAFT_350515 [Aspergillus heteromorphus CBS 117.55]PWY89324.1 hypothetical protein BO70DRAFT_350515 [Aspergillus heteromorphus CBS 117.55]